MDTLKFFGGAILLLGFIFFILIRAVSTTNYIRKSFFLFIAGLVLTLFFCGGMVFDIYKNNFPIFSKSIEYFAFLIVSVAYMILIPLFYFIKGYKRKQRFKNFAKKEKVVPTIKDKKEFVYIIFKHNDCFYLRKYTEKDEIFYSTITLKFGHNDYFHDEVVKNYIIKNKLDITSYKYIGKAIKSLDKDNVYYCYRIMLNSLPEDFNNYEEVDAYKLLSLNLKEDEKKIIFSSVINEEFNIEI